MEQTLDELSRMLLEDFQTFLDPLSTSEVPLLAPVTAEISDIDLKKFQDDSVSFLGPDDEEFELADMNSGDEIDQRILIYLFVRRAAPGVLTRQSMRMKEGFRAMIRSNPTLGGRVGFAHVDKADYIAGVEGSTLVKGIEITLRIQDDDE